jgi:hypothetical protein
MFFLTRVFEKCRSEGFQDPNPQPKIDNVVNMKLEIIIKDARRPYR